jgi:hypothetical protein
LHVSEFAAVAAGLLRLALAQNKIKDAKAWLGRIEQVYPDFRELDDLRRLVALSELGQALKRLGDWKGGKLK